MTTEQKLQDKLRKHAGYNIDTHSTTYMRQAADRIDDLERQLAEAQSKLKTSEEYARGYWLQREKITDERDALQKQVQALQAENKRLKNEVPEDPMDWRLPCSVTVGHGTIGKGCKLRTLVMRMQILYEMAHEVKKS